jgi:hypothetical protein
MVAQSPQGPPPTPAQLEAIMNGPALAPPKGVRPNFVDPWSLEDVFIATATITFTISTFLVMARMYTKAVLMKKFGSEDCKSWLCAEREIRTHTPRAMSPMLCSMVYNPRRCQSVHDPWWRATPVERSSEEHVRSGLRMHSPFRTISIAT